MPWKYVAAALLLGCSGGAVETVGAHGDAGARAEPDAAVPIVIPETPEAKPDAAPSVAPEQEATECALRTAAEPSCPADLPDLFACTNGCVDSCVALHGLCCCPAPEIDVDAGGAVDSGQGVEPGSIEAGQDAAEACAVSLFYLDSDSDGYGDPSEAVEACEAPPGYVDNADDCYDQNEFARPGIAYSSDTDRGDGSFDYNCDGIEKPMRSKLVWCPSSVTPEHPDEIPDCGESSRWTTWFAPCHQSEPNNQQCGSNGVPGWGSCGNGIGIPETATQKCF